MEPTRKRALGVGAGVVGAALLALIGWCVARTPAQKARLGPQAGAVAGAAVALALVDAPGWRVPARCTEPSEDAAPAGAPVRVGARTFTFGADGKLQGGDAARQRVLIGVVADARGADVATLARVRAAAASFAAAHVDVVVSLGGLGSTRAEIEPLLAALASDGWLLVALPGDREAVAAHRETVAALAAHGAHVVDGSALGLLVVDGVTIGLLPGAPAGPGGHAHGLVAGADGCARAGEDLAALERRVAAEPGPHVLAAHQAPRQRGLEATDVALGGVHVGEVGLADLATHVGAVAFVHAGLDETGGRVTGSSWGSTSRAVSTMMWSDHLAVSVGPLEALPHPTWSRSVRDLGAVVVEIDHMRARVRPVRVAARNPGTLQ